MGSFRKKNSFMNLGALVRILLPIKHIQFCDRPTRTRFPVVFLVPRANADLVSKTHVALHAVSATFPSISFKFLPESSPPKAIKTLDVAAFKLGTNAQLSSSAVYCQRSTSTTLPFSIPDSLPCLQLTFSRKTSRQCPKTFQAIVFCFCPSP